MFCYVVSCINILIINNNDDWKWVEFFEVFELCVLNELLICVELVVYFILFLFVYFLFLFCIFLWCVLYWYVVWWELFFFLVIILFLLIIFILFYFLFFRLVFGCFMVLDCSFVGLFLVSWGVMMMSYF